MPGAKIKTSYIHRFSLMIAGVYALGFAGVCSAANETHVILPPLQLFKDFCLDAGWSLSEVSELAAQRHLALMSSDDIPIPDDSPAHKNIWQAETVGADRPGMARGSQAWAQHKAGYVNR